MSAGAQDVATGDCYLEVCGLTQRIPASQIESALFVLYQAWKNLPDSRIDPKIKYQLDMYEANRGLH